MLANSASSTFRGWRVYTENSEDNSVRNTAGLIPFRPGQSGNPGGRPKDIQGVTRLARKLCPKALRRLAEILDDPEAANSDKVRAAQVILDRGLGKVDVVVEEKPAAPFYLPLDEAQVQLAERMVKALPEGETAGALPK